jgi:DnaJ-domain-containing protein 1
MRNAEAKRRGETQRQEEALYYIVIFYTIFTATNSTTTFCKKMISYEIIEDYYALLGVSNIAKTQAVKASYKKLALKHHPDKNIGSATSTATFQQATAAYENFGIRQDLGN